MKLIKRIFTDILSKSLSFAEVAKVAEIAIPRTLVVSTGLDWSRLRSTTAARPPPLDHRRSTTINQTLSRLWHSHH
ncbi:MAG: hypothetical protein V1775_13625 [Bacteroidota bacterium]